MNDLIFNLNLKRRYIIPIIIFLVVVLLFWSLNHLITEESPPIIKTQVKYTSTEPINPLPKTLDLDENKVSLGDKLFHDPILSINNTISCASCHALNNGGTDGIPKSVGINGQILKVNSPTVFNTSFNFRQFWDGRADNLRDQIDGPIFAGDEMGNNNWLEVIDRLNQSSEYSSLFQETYPDGITEDNIKDSLSIFETSLYTPNAPFDLYLRGNENALSEEEKQGYSLFKSYGCVTCHQGILLGGNMFQTFGIIKDYFQDRGNVTKADLGRFNVTGNERDRYSFKVPTLRNIILTSPYFHDGSAKTLDEAIKIMAKYQLGIELSQKDTDLILKFLRTLTGDYQGEAL